MFTLLRVPVFDNFVSYTGQMVPVVPWMSSFYLIFIQIVPVVPSAFSFGNSDYWMRVISNFNKLTITYDLFYDKILWLVP